MPNDGQVPPQTGEGQASNPETTNSDTTQPQTGMTVEQLTEELKRVRSEAASHRTKLRTFEEAQKKAEEASLSEVEKLKRQVADSTTANSNLQQQLRTLQAEREIGKIQGVVDAETVMALVSSKIEWGEDGNPTNINNLVSELRKTKPFLFGGVSGNAASNPPRGQQADTETASSQLLSRGDVVGAIAAKLSGRNR